MVERLVLRTEFALCVCSYKRCGTVKPAHTHVQDLLTPLSLCTEVVHKDVRMCAMVEPLHQSPTHLVRLVSMKLAKVR